MGLHEKIFINLFTNNINTCPHEVQAKTFVSQFAKISVNLPTLTIEIMLKSKEILVAIFANYFQVGSKNNCLTLFEK